MLQHVRELRQHVQSTDCAYRFGCRLFSNAWNHDDLLSCPRHQQGQVRTHRLRTHRLLPRFQISRSGNVTRSVFEGILTHNQDQSEFPVLISSRIEFCPFFHRSDDRSHFPTFSLISMRVSSACFNSISCSS